MAIVRGIIGAVVGFLLAGAFHYFVLRGLGMGSGGATTVALIAGVIGGAYSAIAVALRAYGLGVFGVAGYVMDMTWSLLNTTAGLLVWMPACLIGGGSLKLDADSRRSGTFPYDKNPRGGGYDATTIGTVIGGGWSSHEEVHVWQARMFGPAYMLVYVLCLGLNVLARLATGRTGSGLVEQAYRRICWEDWAYMGGKVPGGTINWAGWVGGFLLCVLYVGLVLLIPIGIAHQAAALWAVGLGGVLVYSVIRSFTPGST